MPYEPCEKRPGRVSSLSLVRYRNNDYSVPTAWGHRAVMIRGYVDRVEIVSHLRRAFRLTDDPSRRTVEPRNGERRTGASDV
jgi:hypothetical protein